ncbi:MAG: hypothetical protein K2N62_00700, partial [Desulfovibrio sp.]|nr:hypothetical protein [Desulfovibrio sp.]
MPKLSVKNSLASAVATQEATDEDSNKLPKCQPMMPLSLSVSPASRATATASVLAASEKNFLGRVLKYTPFGNFYLPCKHRKILFFRILPAPSLLSMPVRLTLL